MTTYNLLKAEAITAIQTDLENATAADRVQTGLDAAATAADRVQTGLDAAATAADRVQTGLDVVEAGTLASSATTVAMLLAILGQVSGQVNGGQIELKGGTLADPPLKIGTVGIYSSAADTLSIAIAGTEVARFTSSGLSVLGGTVGSL